MKVENNTKLKIVERIYELNLWYPYTICKILFLNAEKEIINDMSVNELENLIISLEQFCHILLDNKTVNLNNITDISVKIFKNDKNLFDMIKFLNVFSCTQNSRYEFLSNMIVNSLENYQFNNIDLNSTNSKIKEQDQESYINKNNLKYIILDYINSYNYKYADILMKFFLDNEFIVKSQKIKKEKMISFLYYISELIGELDLLFNKDILFLNRMLNKIINSDMVENYFETNDFMSQCDEEVTKISKKIIANKFENGIVNFEEYIKRFENSSKYSLDEFGTLEEETKISYIKKFCCTLETVDIYSIFY